MLDMESDYTARTLGYESAGHFLEDPHPEHRNLETYDLIFASPSPEAVTTTGHRLLQNWLAAYHQDLNIRAAATDTLWDGDWMADDTHLTREATILIFVTLDRLEAASK